MSIKRKLYLLLSTIYVFYIHQFQPLTLFSKGRSAGLYLVQAMSTSRSETKIDSLDLQRASPCKHTSPTEQCTRLS